MSLYSHEFLHLCQCLSTEPIFVTYQLHNLLFFQRLILRLDLALFAEDEGILAVWIRVRIKAGAADGMATKECERVLEILQTTQAAESAVEVGSVLGVFIQDSSDLLSKLI